VSFQFSLIPTLEDDLFLSEEIANDVVGDIDVSRLCSAARVVSKFNGSCVVRKQNSGDQRNTPFR